MLNQTTISKPISCYGIGVHTGHNVHLTVRPAKADTGIVFKRTDVTQYDPYILASFLNVNDTSMSTSVANNSGISVSTIEHLMAAIWARGIDNLLIEIDGPEVPIMDGSSEPFYFMLECAGTKHLRSKRKVLHILKEVKVIEGNSEAYFTPADDFIMNMEIDFKSNAIGKQKFTYRNGDSFKKEVARARTFGFMEDVERLKSKGLALGASLENAVAIQGDTIVNPEGLRYNDEFVRHKMLDAIGDLFTCGLQIQGQFYGSKSGHNVNNLLLRKLFEDKTAYSFIAPQATLQSVIS